MDRDSIIGKILSFIQQRGPAKSWYAGISKDARRRLFTDHRVDEAGDLWIICPADNEAIAREVESILLKKATLDGDTGGGDAAATQVYAFKKTMNTDPWARPE